MRIELILENQKTGDMFRISGKEISVIPIIDGYEEVKIEVSERQLIALNMQLSNWLEEYKND